MGTVVKASIYWQLLLRSVRLFTLPLPLCINMCVYRRERGEIVPSLCVWLLCPTSSTSLSYIVPNEAPGKLSRAVHLPNSSSSSSISKQLPVRLWTTELGNQQFSFVANLTVAKTVRCGPYTWIIIKISPHIIYSETLAQTDKQSLTKLTHTSWARFLVWCLCVFVFFSAQFICLKKIQLLTTGNTKWPPVGTKCLEWTTW